MARVRCPDVCSHLKLPPPVLKLATLFLPVLDSLIRLALRTRVSTPFVYYHPGLLSSWLSCRPPAEMRDGEPQRSSIDLDLLLSLLPRPCHVPESAPLQVLRIILISRVNISLVRPRRSQTLRGSTGIFIPTGLNSDTVLYPDVHIPQTRANTLVTRNSFRTAERCAVFRRQAASYLR